jgi:UDP-N-acetylglucosamine--N-acetylmuramyl-(pentapeptide) pyrophosphoryl-undecaprenol N-acetylglucosamine transferase
MKKKTIVITGGGTGGHIYPGLAIAQSLQKNYADIQVHFVGAQGGLEEKIWPQYSFPYHLIKIGRLHSSVGRWQQFKTLLMMPFSLFHALWIFFKIKPQLVLGVGGFASGPFLLIAKIFGAKTALWEANAYPGLTNRWLARWVDMNFIVFGEAKKFLSSDKIIESGMPVREEFFTANKQEPAASRLRVLVFGGSQGAKAVNDAILTYIKSYPQILEQISLKHQTGARDFARMKEQYGSLVDKVDLVEYIHNMPQELKRADVVICRSGASTVAEVISCKKPAIFIPLPTAADNHQYKNAKVVADEKAAYLIEQKNLSPENLQAILSDLLQSPQKLDDMAKRLEKFNFSHSTQMITDSLVKEISL